MCVCDTSIQKLSTCTCKLCKLSKEEGSVGHDDKHGGLQQRIVSQFRELHELHEGKRKKIQLLKCYHKIIQDDYIHIQVPTKSVQ